MCGIVGYVGVKDATPVLINALKKLEYRGYDSAGIAVLNDEEIIVRKAKGALKFLEEKIASETIKGSLGIGHTRWATHGEPSEINAHPHTNVSGTIAVVHNGIIENYTKLKAWLQSQGVIFKSQTDTEVVAHLINYYYEETGDILKAVLNSMKKLEGSFALGVLCRDFPDRIVAARKDSPLIVGTTPNENFIASDVPAVLEYTREIYFLEQKEIAVLYQDHVDLFNEDGEKIIKNPVHVDWDMSAAEKSGYPHFMIKEIEEQPKAFEDTLKPHLVMENNTAVDIVFDELDFNEDWKNAGRIIITACGTAYHAGVVGKYAFEKYARVPVVVDVASEFQYRDPVFMKDDVFVVISQSGETADTLSALRLAKKAGVKVIAITNCVGSSISREADSVIYTLAGPEIAVASTKAYTTQLMCLYLLALKLGKERGTLPLEEYHSLLAQMRLIPEKARQIVSKQAEIQTFASTQFNKSKIFYIGRLFDSASSLESALKLKEVSYMHCEAFAAGELKHGPIALVDSDTLVIAIATQEPMYEKLASNILEVKARNASTMVITQAQNGEFDQCADTVINLPETDDGLASMLSVIPAQLFAYYCSVFKGLDPDKPRNLAKSVTVE